jgi:hypothetical protein
MDPHQSYKQDLGPHQSDADPQHRGEQFEISNNSGAVPVVRMFPRLPLTS